jgi:D-lactate dehydrogenase
MKKIVFFDSKPYDEEFFNQYNKNYQIKYFEPNLNQDTAHLVQGSEGVIAFVNDVIDAPTIGKLHELGVKIIALRSAGYNNVDVKAAFEKITIVRVPSYSPEAVAEHTMALLLTLNRKIHKAYNRTRDFNFSLNGLMGFVMLGKTIGIIGTGKIGRAFSKICRGFGMKVLAYDPYPASDSDLEYVGLEKLFQESDIISLHCPLTEETKHLINEESLALMRDGVYLINTSRGGLIDSHALLSALKTKKVKGAGLDVYEEETEIFYEDYSEMIINDDTLALLVSLPNVIITSHQAFFTKEAMDSIARITLDNLDKFFNGEELENEICYLCKEGEAAIECRKNRKRCF